MDEVGLLIDLVSTNWASSATTLQSAGTITADRGGGGGLGTGGILGGIAGGAIGSGALAGSLGGAGT